MSTWNVGIAIVGLLLLAAFCVMMQLDGAKDVVLTIGGIIGGWLGRGMADKNQH